MSEENKNQIVLKEILLLESSFKRNLNIESGEQEESSVNLDVSKKIEGEFLFSTLTLVFKSAVNDISQIEAKITFVGVFKHNNIEDIETFAEINAPAIIYPFIREHLSTLTLKGLIAPVLLPPVNFVKLSEEKDKS